MFEIMNGREYFYQWDSNQKLIINEPSCNEVHFCNRTDDCALVCQIYELDGQRVADVPNILLQNSWPLYVYVFATDYTKVSAIYKVVARNKPDDYVYTETEVLNYDSLSQRIDELENDIGQVVEDYLAEHPIEGAVQSVNGKTGAVTLTAADVGAASEQYVDDAIDTIELTPGPVGPAGKDGNDGVSAEHSWSGTVLTITSASGTSSADLVGPAGKDGTNGKDGVDGAPGKDGVDGYTPVKGVDYFDGQDGAPGKDGADGYTPVKGVDYWTATDKQEIVNETVQAIPVATTAAAGIVKPDGTTITIDADGTISSVGGGSGGVGQPGTAEGAEIFNDVANNEASGEDSHAEGTYTVASGNSSHAEGNGTKATNFATHAEGHGAQATGYGAHVEGLYTIASGQYQHVQGKYNEEDSSMAHIVGGGYNIDDLTVRENIHTLDWDGNAWFAGKVTVGSGKEELQTAAQVQAMIDAGGGSGASTAADVSFDDSVAGIGATNVQDALEALADDDVSTEVVQDMIDTSMNVRSWVKAVYMYLDRTDKRFNASDYGTNMSTVFSNSGIWTNTGLLLYWDLPTESSVCLLENAANYTFNGSFRLSEGHWYAFYQTSENTIRQCDTFVTQDWFIGYNSSFAVEAYGPMIAKLGGKPWVIQDITPWWTWTEQDNRITALEEGGGGGAGEDGGYYTPAVDTDGNLSWTASKSDMPAVAGSNIKGPAGQDGTDGATPVRGTDYWTAADQEQIVNEVKSTIFAFDETTGRLDITV